MNAQPKIELVKPSKNPDAQPFAPELLQHVMVELHKTGMKPGEHGFRLATIATINGDARLILAAQQFADDHDLGLAGVRGERLGGGVQADYVASSGGYTQTRMDALKRYREATQAVGMIASAMLYRVCVDCLSASEIARRMGHSDHKKATRHALKALNALADWYESPKRK
ncbi:MAG: hypothetical protein P4L10_10995 [Acidobacteriaceae bacterium]|nr:hypothetical protein [Acidobacteriaceae bacterium]